MTGDQVVLLALAGLAVLCVVLLVSLAVMRRAWTRDLRSARADLADVRRRLDEVERRPASSAAHPASSPSDAIVITGLGAESETEPPAPPIDRVMFTDIVVREAVVKTASLAHGVRRALAPATRNRIRFEMRQEVRRARKQRRADVKAAQRDLRARERAGLGLAEESR